MGQPKLEFEKVNSDWPIYRAKVHGGWLVFHGGNGGMTFYPDAMHAWDGGSLP